MALEVEWVEEYDLNYSTVNDRLLRGWSHEEAVFGGKNGIRSGRSC